MHNKISASGYMECIQREKTGSGFIGRLIERRVVYEAALPVVGYDTERQVSRLNLDGLEVTAEYLLGTDSKVLSAKVRQSLARTGAGTGKRDVFWV